MESTRSLPIFCSTAEAHHPRRPQSQHQQRPPIATTTHFQRQQHYRRFDPVATIINGVPRLYSRSACQQLDVALSHPTLLLQMRGGGSTTPSTTSNFLLTPFSMTLHALQRLKTYLQASKQRCWLLLLLCVLLDTGSTVLMKSVSTTTVNNHSKVPRILCAFTGYFLRYESAAAAMGSVVVGLCLVDVERGCWTCV